MKHILKINRDFWRIHVPSCWDKEPLDNKLAWIVFGTYTVALITLIELFLLKR